MDTPADAIRDWIRKLTVRKGLQILAGRGSLCARGVQMKSFARKRLPAAGRVPPQRLSGSREIRSG